MDGASLTLLAVGAAGLGLASHLLFFIHGEQMLNAPKFLACGLLSPCLAVVGLLNFFPFSFLRALRYVSVLWWAYVLALYTSILVYRVFFHRLGNFPGPFGARVSKLWHSSNLTGFDNYKFLEKLHEQYGDYVRTGPNEISVSDPDVVDMVHGPRSTCYKSQWYAMNEPMTTLHQMRDRGMHDRRRRGGWDKAFSMKCLRAYDSRVTGYADELLRQLSSFSGKPVNVSKWFNYYSWDVMGELSFGRSFNALKNAESHFAMDIMHQSLVALGLFSPTPWILRTLIQLPDALNSSMPIIKYSEECVKERKGRTPEEADVMSHLLEGEPFFDNKKEEDDLLTGEARLIITAGSDTTAASLTYIFYRLSEDPTRVQKLRTELNENGIHHAAGIAVQDLQHLPYLNAVINETLRLHPPVPDGVFRDTGAHGLQIGEHYIPGNVTILTPIYAIQRSPKAFVHPHEFLPERWTTQPELILHKSAFFPFLTGPYSCIGKQLALMELWTVVAKLVLEFDFGFAPGEDGSDLLEKTKDVFTLILGKLEICFQRRAE